MISDSDHTQGGRPPVESVRCSFCGKPRDAVRAIVGGPTREIAICDECVALCSEIIAEETGGSPGEPPTAA